MLNLKKRLDLIIHQNRKSIFKWAFIAWYGGGKFVFHKFGAQTEGWYKAFYIWECLAFLLALIAVCVTSKKMFLLFYPLIFYAFASFCVELVTISKELAAVNDKETVDMLLYMCIGGCAILFLNPIVSSWYDKSDI